MKKAVMPDSSKCWSRDCFSGRPFVGVAGALGHQASHRTARHRPHRLHQHLKVVAILEAPHDLPDIVSRKRAQVLCFLLGSGRFHTWPSFSSRRRAPDRADHGSNTPGIVQVSNHSASRGAAERKGPCGIVLQSFGPDVGEIPQGKRHRCWPVGRAPRGPSWVLKQGRSHPMECVPDCGHTSQDAVWGQLPSGGLARSARAHFKRYTTDVPVPAGFGVGSPYICHDCPADSLRFRDTTPSPHGRHTSRVERNSAGPICGGVACPVHSGEDTPRE